MLWDEINSFEIRSKIKTVVPITAKEAIMLTEAVVAVVAAVEVAAVIAVVVVVVTVVITFQSSSKFVM